VAPHWAYWGGGLGFPWFVFGPIFFFLFILFIFWIVRGALWGFGRHPGRWDGGPWSGSGARFYEWHRQAHEQDRGTPGTGSETDPGRTGPSSPA